LSSTERIKASKKVSDTLSLPLTQKSSTIPVDTYWTRKETGGSISGRADKAADPKSYTLPQTHKSYGRPHMYKWN
jgi:hypothetical protein